MNITKRKKCDFYTVARRHGERLLYGFFWLVVSTGILLSGCSMVGIQGVEEPGYELVEQEGAFEIRRYASLVVAQTEVAVEDQARAGDIAFKRLFGYISGNNESQASIKMTAPVISRPSSSEGGEKIAMTAPVLSQATGQRWRYAFVLPAQYTVESAPLPLDSEVRVTALPPAKFAVIRFSGSWSESLFEQKSKELLEFVMDKKLTPIASPSIARYDPPWTLPLLKRNEVMIRVEETVKNPGTRTPNPYFDRTSGINKPR